MFEPQLCKDHEIFLASGLYENNAKLLYILDLSDLRGQGLQTFSRCLHTVIKLSQNILVWLGLKSENEARQGLALITCLIRSTRPSRKSVIN